MQSMQELRLPSNPALPADLHKSSIRGDEITQGGNVTSSSPTVGGGGPPDREGGERVALVNPSRDAGAIFSGGGGRVGQRVRVPKTAELVAAHLRQQIVRNELHEGDALPPEAVLMAQFGVSRPTLREAFRVLEAEGLISVRRGAHGGARVHTPDVDVAARYAGLVLEHRGATLTDVYEAAGLVEPSCAAALATKHSDTDLSRLRECLAQGELALKNGADDVEIQAVQDAFHALVVELTGNQTVIVLTRMMRSIVEVANTTMAAHAG